MRIQVLKSACRRCVRSRTKGPPVTGKSCDGLSFAASQSSSDLHHIKALVETHIQLSEIASPWFMIWSGSLVKYVNPDSQGKRNCERLWHIQMHVGRVYITSNSSEVINWVSCQCQMNKHVCCKWTDNGIIDYKSKIWHLESHLPFIPKEGKWLWVYPIGAT